jgi:D-3-phosphoglycerate dehydrogenase / 2-oxoglutarate reductase
MIKIQTFNKISDKGLNLFPTQYYQVSSDCTDPDAILLRSQSLHDMPLPNKLKAIARAGAGVNNIPVDKMTEFGIPVFNTPGANANAVKELVIASLILANRNICTGWHEALSLKGQDVPTQVETIKKQFTGTELQGKKLGIIGLGAIGVKVANAACLLGLDVIAFDPHITIKNAWQLSAKVEQASSMNAVLGQADFITLHIPYTKHTHHLIDENSLKQINPHSILLNFSRADIIDSTAVINALNNNQLSQYVTDFPTNELLNTANTLCLPHLGASTVEAEENCAIMAVNTLRRFLETGEIENSVNFPTVNMPYQGGVRFCIVNRNIPNMLGQISSTIASKELNIKDLINRSKKDIAYTLIDVEDANVDEALSLLKQIDGVINCRKLLPNDN